MHKGDATLAGLAAWLRAACDGLEVKAYDLSLSSERKDGRSAMYAFAARQAPFCGVTVHGRPVRGFWTEDGSCSAEAVRNYALRLFGVSAEDAAV